MNNKQIKQSIVDTKLKGRSLFWFGETTEKFLAKSFEEVVEQHIEWIGEEEVNFIIESGDYGKLNMSASDWFKFQCWNEEIGKLEPNICAVYGDGLVQVSTSYL